MHLVIQSKVIQLNSLICFIERKISFSMIYQIRTYCSIRICTISKIVSIESFVIYFSIGKQNQVSLMYLDNRQKQTNSNV